MALGGAASLALNRFLATQLYEVRTTDPAVYGTISAMLLLVAIAAVAGPAARAMRIDPASALRHD
jgi:putative ABC transport system permease protein